MKFIRRSAAAVLLLFMFAITAGAAPETLVIGGNVIGLKIKSDGVTIVEFTENAPQQAGLKRGDILQKINDVAIKTVQDISEQVQKSDGKPLKLTILRGDATRTVTLAATQTADGEKLGILVRDELIGVGTVTYYNPQDGSFGALGHGISDGTTLLPMRNGDVLPSQVAGVTKGRCGDPGCLQGALCGREVSGKILKNTQQGIFGTMEQPNGTALAVASASEIRTGKAQIVSNVHGREVCYYDVQILALYPNEKNDRNLLLKVTDPTLLAQTGGIVQGMSGSPIIQDGKLIGAVTHVLIDDPTTGYGIFIENMLDAAEGNGPATVPSFSFDARRPLAAFSAIAPLRKRKNCGMI